jgi:hypothetical protein
MGRRHMIAADHATYRKARAFAWWRVVGAVLIALSPILVPNAHGSARGETCATNLRQIDGAIQQWALANKRSGTNTVSLADPEVLRYLRGSVLPVCRDGGTYLAPRTIAKEPVCSIHGDYDNARNSDRSDQHADDLQRAQLTTILGLICLALAGHRLSRPAGQRKLLIVLPWIFFFPGLLLCAPELLLAGNQWTYAHYLNGVIFGAVGVLLSAIAMSSPSRPGRLGAQFVGLLYGLMLAHEVVQLAGI